MATGGSIWVVVSELTSGVKGKKDMLDISSKFVEFHLWKMLLLGLVAAFDCSKPCVYLVHHIHNSVNFS